MSEKSLEQQVQEEVYRSKIPALPGDRLYSGWSHTMTATAWSIATWLFVMGSTQVLAVPLWPAIAATFFGCTIPLLGQSLLGRFFARWGVDTAFGARATFGPLGTKIIVLIFGILPTWCWMSIPAVMFGRGMSLILRDHGVTGWISNYFLWGCVVAALGLFIAYKGPHWMKWAFNIATPAMLILIAIITVKVLSTWSLGEIAAVRPEGFVADPYINYVLAIEMAIGLGVGWVFQFAAYGRICKSEAGAFYGSFLGWGIMWALLCIPAMFVTLMTGEVDIVDGINVIGGDWAVVYLGLLVIANPSSFATNGYLVGLTLRNFFPRLRWSWAILVSISILGLVVFPSVYDQFSHFIVIMATALVSWGAVWVMDLVLRRFQVDLRGLYDESSKGCYYYYKGINPFPIIAVACGIAVSLAIWTPWTFVIRAEGVFKVVGGSIPGAFAACVVYYVLYRLFLKPKKVGLPDIVIPDRVTPESSTEQPAVEL